MRSIFLDIPEREWLVSNELAFAIRDTFPVTDGHTLIIARRQVRDWFDATRDEQRAMLDLVEVVKLQLDAEHQPAGYNVGFNVGVHAGQTVMHLHVHVIPRYEGDMDDPAGGVRHVIPWKGNYRRLAAEPLVVGGTADPFLAHIRPLFAGAREIAIVAAFVQDSGLELLQDPVFSAADRGARIRLITGDYLDITQAEALKRMLDWQGALAPAGAPPRFEARIVETARLAGSRSFHPKSWRFEGEGLGVAFVGSSNVSASALWTGVEWNLRTDRSRDPIAYASVKEAFEAVWAGATPLTLEWVTAYAARARVAPVALPPGETEAEPLTAAPDPHEIQRDALDALAATRADGEKRALVVMATGLGKTLLAAYDADAFRSTLDHPIRVLFIAHRRELLVQAATTFRRVLRGAMPDLRVGWFAEDRSELEADIVVASVQKLSRPENLERLAAERFDYVVVDEVHHAEAPSYRRILSRIDPGFLLGLTATPDRADEGDVLGLFDDNLPFRADLGVGIEAKRLVPFAYFGLKDTVDYSHDNIPWRNRRFDPKRLEEAVQTQERMERLWSALGEHGGMRTLVFCCSIPHAEFAKRWLEGRGVRVRAVHSDPGSDDRSRALADLAAGRIDAVCAVDLFNEGVDVPLVDRVVMLRPTESPVVFLQQLGRGLRIAEGKERLTVIDFVGNHRVFLDRVRTLLSLGDARPDLRAFLEGGEAELPPGCSIDVQLDAIDLLRRLLPSGANAVERAYRELQVARGERPTIGELYRSGYSPSVLRQVHGSWFEFVRSEGHLTADEERVLEAGRDWYRELETTVLEKSFKLVLLEAVIELEALGTGVNLDVLARRSHQILVRSPELFRDLNGVNELPDPRVPAERAWLAYWRKNPVKAWAGTPAEPKRWFAVEGDRFLPKLPIPTGLEETVVEMTRELVDYRLAQYRRRFEPEVQGDAFVCKVISNERDPILMLPPRMSRPDLPTGDTDVRLAHSGAGSPTGAWWRFRFVKIACNVAHPVGSTKNLLPDILRAWFGPAVGRAGTAFRIRFFRSPDGWNVEPLGQMIDLPSRGRVVAFPTLRAAAGAAGAPTAGAPEAEEVVLPVPSRGAELFAVRAAGNSMAGGGDPIRDGDWLLFRYARGAGLGAVEGRVALVQVSDGSGDGAYQVKRIVRRDGRWLLASDNPGIAPFAAQERTVPVAILAEHVSPEALAPEVGAHVEDGEVGKAFGLDADPRDGLRVGGHLFVMVDGRGVLSAPDRVTRPVPARRPGETAFVFARGEGTTWRYCGVGRWNDDERAWVIPEVDYGTWKHLGVGRTASRRLPEPQLERARALATAAVERFGGNWIERDGKRCRVVGLAERGGVRIDGGPDGFRERTVSLVDLAWVLVARDDVEAKGGVLDEARVNLARYLEGTPKEATRWIDTRWALVIAAAVASA
ncbi:DEAD/DEAH box helicase family protein [Anaeromyxobacter sp. Fw109-5]|uniref:DEAD/DEAH box helicase family protein n=1 Tax=Anaeromyxobacter sp. (strain Fw109-5) TaxID=404589 RepID=UPI0000ED6F0B|nr:DEAD/DEAH box helicase family protein [Anaeromyxobacter sp. Fw109-5]ABS28162.1 type III restriction protein res subunit [Anaeromyxobacter sp. Fw109-5]